jgi:hypothetical protein
MILKQEAVPLRGKPTQTPYPAGSSPQTAKPVRTFIRWLAGARVTDGEPAAAWHALVRHARRREFYPLSTSPVALGDATFCSPGRSLA